MYTLTISLSTLIQEKLLSTVYAIKLIAKAVKRNGKNIANMNHTKTGRFANGNSKTEKCGFTSYRKCG